MSFGLPPLKVEPSVSTKNFVIKNQDYEISNPFTHGFSCPKTEVEGAHPLLHSELNYRDNKQKMNMAILRSIQGLHAPLKIGMELNAAKKIGHLPFLKSSNVMLHTLVGRDLEIAPEDVFGNPEFYEYAGRPHAVVEKSLNIL